MMAGDLPPRRLQCPRIHPGSNIAPISPVIGRPDFGGDEEFLPVDVDFLEGGSDEFFRAISARRVHQSQLGLLHGDTVVENSQEYRLEYWATRSSIRSFARTAQSFARSLTSLTPLLVGQ